MLRTKPVLKILQNKMEQRHRKYDYTRKRSSNELIEAMAVDLRRVIKEQIDEIEMYSVTVLIDECTMLDKMS